MELLTPDIGLIFWQSIVFLIVFIVLAVFAWRPISGALKAREFTISDSLEAAEKAKKEVQQIKSENESLLKEARLERDAIIKNAQEAAQQIKEATKLETAVIKDRMINEAKIVIESEKKATISELKTLVSDLSLEIARKILRNNLEKDGSHELLVNKYLEEVQNS